MPSCDLGAGLAESYQATLACDGSGPCNVEHSGLAPGEWVHRISIGDGEQTRQRQARRTLVLDASAGSYEHAWTIYRQGFEVSNTADAIDCEGCLRRAIDLANAAPGPSLIFFDPATTGDIVVSEALPALTADSVTIDAIDNDGVPYRRTVDGNGLSQAALRITGSFNQVVGLRITNVGGDADMLLIDGPGANGNRIESVQIVGRGLEICERLGETGCVVDRQCVVPNRIIPRGDCGDDGIAVRDSAGQSEINVLYAVDVSGAFDKGIKVSEGGVVRVENSWVHGNADGGIQATLEGNLIAIRNRSEGNRGTAGANGIAANGARIDGNVASVVTTRGNLTRDNALRGVSVRSLSQATLRDDFVCGNGTAGTDVGFGLALLDAAGFSGVAEVSGVALVNNVDGGVLAMGDAQGNFGTETPGRNAFAFNGAATNLTEPTNFRNLSTQSMSAQGNHWESCEPGYVCNIFKVVVEDIYAPDAAVDPIPARPTSVQRAPVISEIVPSSAKAGELVWMFGENFDAIGFAAEDSDCNGPDRPCSAADANCIVIDRQPAQIVAATPTMLVFRAPFTCVEPVKLLARTRHSRGAARASFCGY